MSPVVKVLYRTLCAQAESPMVILRGEGQAEEMQRQMGTLMADIGLSQARLQRGTIQTGDCRFTFVSGADLDTLCGVRADLMFARLSEWTQEEVNCSLKPFLVSRFGLHRWKTTQALLKKGHMTEADLIPASIDDYLVNLDLP